MEVPMKIILTGATGFVGGEVLRQLLTDPAVSEVTCLGRRTIELPSPKLKSIILGDFANYDPILIKNLMHYDGCIWALGGKAKEAASAEEFRKITHTYPIEFARAMIGRITRPFRFCYLSSIGADPDGKASFSFKKQTRQAIGLVERDLAELARENPLFYASAFRAGAVLPVEIGRVKELFLAPISIRVDLLARTMIREIARKDAVRFHCVTNRQIKVRAPDAL
jgi:hypothetical protein